jgi:hypothetical protein
LQAWSLIGLSAALQRARQQLSRKPPTVQGMGPGRRSGSYRTIRGCTARTDWTPRLPTARQVAVPTGAGVVRPGRTGLSAVGTRVLPCQMTTRRCTRFTGSAPPSAVRRRSTSGGLIARCVEHWSRKTWITEAKRIDLEWFTATEIADAERQAIELEHPVYNVQHNGGRVRIELAGEISYRPASPEEIALKMAAPVAAGMGAVRLFDTLANWSVKRRAHRAGQELELPPARNLFTQEPRHWSKALLDGLLSVAAGPTPEQKALWARFAAVYMSGPAPDRCVPDLSADHQAGDGLGRRQRVAAEGLQADAGTEQS